MSCTSCSDKDKQKIKQEACIYKNTKNCDLTQFEKVNAAAGEICISDLSLLSRRGELLEMASRMVAEEGYNFKKGFAILKCMERTETSSAVK